MFLTFENKIQRNSNMGKTKVGREKNIDTGSLTQTTSYILIGSFLQVEVSVIKSTSIGFNKSENVTLNFNKVGTILISLSSFADGCVLFFVLCLCWS